MKKILLLITAIGFLVSCQDFLVEEPVLDQTTNLTLSTYEGLNSATVGAYSPLYSSTWYGRDFILNADLMGGIAKLGPISSGRFTEAYHWNWTESSTSNLWTYAYYVISLTNNVINNLSNVTDPTISNEDIEHLEAECLFLRSLSYFDLVRVYAQPYSYDPDMLGVPIVFESDITNFPKRNTISEVYKQLKTDLLKAEELFGTYKRTGGIDNTSFASKEATQALLARVYLYTEQWDSAAMYATKLIDNGNYSLATPEEYVVSQPSNSGIWGADDENNNPEMIFSVYGAEGNSYSANWDVMPWMLSPWGYGDVNASTDLTGLFEANDVRADLFIKHPDYGDVQWSSKYPGKGAGEGKDRNLREGNIPVLRLSEMYLIRSEALSNDPTAMSGVTALDDYNDLRAQRGLAASNVVTNSMIYSERMRELCFEGHASFDLSRTGRGMTRTDYIGSTSSVAFPDSRWALPIPLAEIDANENMVQNP